MDTGVAFLCASAAVTVTGFSVTLSRGGAVFPVRDCASAILAVDGGGFRGPCPLAEEGPAGGVPLRVLGLRFFTADGVGSGLG